MGGNNVARNFVVCLHLTENQRENHLAVLASSFGKPPQTIMEYEENMLL